MLPRLRASAKKAIGLLERRVSSSEHSLKQVNLHVEILKHILNLTSIFSQQLTTLHPIVFSPKQTNETSGFVRNQHKAELPPDAKATSAAMPKPPSPPTTGASSSASSSSSSSVFSSWKFRPSFSKYALTLGPLGVLGAGALLYSLSGNADGGSDDRRKSSKWKAESPFFNRSSEQMEFKDKFNDKPGVITVLVGPPSCGKSVRSAFFFFANI
jgi:hypothetical protein